MTPGDELVLRIDKPVAGGRMLARHEGMVVLVAGAIPAETVRVRIERVERSLAYAGVVDVLEPHPLRRPTAHDPRCGGAAYAHVQYAHQLDLKREVIRDTLQRLARVEWEAPIPATASPETGYRMRARLHLREGRVGFFLEGTHQVCDAAATGQLLPSTMAALSGAVRTWERAGVRGDADIELSENVPGDQRTLHIEWEPGARVRAAGAWPATDGVTGLSWSARGEKGEHVVAGEAQVADTIPVPGAPAQAVPVRLQRRTRAFFQGNRYLVDALVRAVIERCPEGPVLDLYAGVGLFGVLLAAAGRHPVTAVEGHPSSAADLRANAAPYGERVRVHEMSVERFLQRRPIERPAAVVVDPPRAGMTRDALTGVLALGAPRLVFVSCDLATFARDVRLSAGAGYQLSSIEAFDLFPNTPHVEVVATLSL